jgi:membrane protein
MVDPDSGGAAPRVVDPRPAGQEPKAHDAPSGPSGAETPPPVIEKAGRLAAGKARATKLRTRAEGTTAGHVQRRIGELDMLNQAAILSALAMVLVVPALVSLAAIVPVGQNHGLAAAWLNHLALSAQARKDVHSLFATDQTVHASTTFVSGLFTIVAAYAWPAELQKAYVTMWGLTTRGWRDLWRPILWIPSLFALIFAVAASGAVTSGVAGAVVVGIVGFPLVFGWAWWSQHLLLSGRVSWRDLFPGAIATAIGVVGGSVFSTIYLSGSVVYNFDRYGPLGIVFVLMTWLTTFSLVMLGGALVGHTIWLRHQPDDNETLPTPPDIETLPTPVPAAAGPPKTRSDP